MANGSWKQRRAQQDHYLKNKDAIKARAVEWTKQQRALLAGYVRKAKDVPCADCEVQYPHYVMEFDHVRGKKQRNVADLVSRGVSLRTLRMEIAKCEIVCSNCHAARTWRRRQESLADGGRLSEVDAELRLF